MGEIIKIGNINGYRRNVPRVIYVILLIFSVIYVSNHGGAFSYALFYAVLLYIPFSLLYMIHAVLVLRIYQEIDERLLYKNTEVRYRLTVQNIGVIPVSGITFHHNDYTMFRDEFTDGVFSFQPREKLELENGLSCRYSGNYESGVDYYYLRDVFGIICIKKRIDVPLRISVLPNITDVASGDIEKLFSSRENREKVPLDSFEEILGNDIRKYAEGDPLSRVHWKNYARTGEMFTRLPEHQESGMIHMVLVSGKNTGTKEDMKRKDSYLEYAVSVCQYFAKRKKPVKLYYYNNGVKSCIVDSLVSFRDFYMEIIERLAREVDEKTESEIRDVLGNLADVAVFLREDSFQSE